MFRERDLEAREWVIRHVETEHLSFERELVTLGPLGTLGHFVIGRLLVGLPQRIEVEPDLAVRLTPLVHDGLLGCVLVDLEQGASRRSHRVEGTGFDEGLDRALVRDVERHGAQELVERPERLILARRDDTVDDVRADIAHGSETEADVFTDGRKVADRLFYIGRQHPDAHSATLVEVDRHLVFRIADARQQRGHVLGGIVRLEVGRPVRHEPVSGGVRLVEGVVGERQEDVPECLDRAVAEAALFHAAREALVLLVELGLLLLAHRAPQDVGLTEREPGDLLRDRHDLLLIDDQAVCRIEDVAQRLFELRMDRCDRLQAVLPQCVVGVRVRTHRAGSVQRDDGRDVFEVVGLHEAQKRAHRPAVELENTESVTAGQQVVGGAVIEREVFEIEFFATVHADVVERVGDDREVAQPQEVHLDEAEGLTRRVVELGDDLAVLLAAHDRDDVEQRLGRHDDTGRVHAPLALQPLEPERSVENGLGVGIDFDQRAELARLFVALVLGVEHAPEFHVFAHHGGRHGLRQLFAHAERETEHAPGIFQRLLRLDRAVRDDLRHALGAVLVGDVLDDLAAATVIEIDVEVGHRDAIGVEEALEDEAVLEGVEIGDLHGVGDHGPGTRTATRPHADAVVFGPVDEVGDDEEVPREPHLQDDAGLVLGLLAHLVGDACGITVVQSLFNLFHEPAVFGLTIGHGEARHVVRRGVELDLAALGDEKRVVAGLGVITEHLPHFGRSLDVVAIAVELEAVRVIESRARLHAQQRRVRVGLVLVRVVRVVGRDERDVEVFREPQQIGHDASLDRETVVHDLGEIVLFAEDVLELGRRRSRSVVLPESKPRLHFTRRTPRRRDEARTIGLQQFAVHARLEVVALHARERAEPEQVVHARGVLAPQRHVCVGARPRDVVALLIGRSPLHARLVAAMRAGSHVGLEADDRFDARGLGRVVELEGRERVAVVGHRDRRHAVIRRRLRHGADLRGAVEHGVLAVYVQMNEGVGWHESSLRSASDIGRGQRQNRTATARPPRRRAQTARRR